MMISNCLAETSCSSAPPVSSTPHSIRSRINRKKVSENPINSLLLIQEKKLKFEKEKFELEKEKEKNKAELKRIELQNQLEIKKIKIEAEKEAKLQIVKLRLESDERIKMFEV